MAVGAIVLARDVGELAQLPARKKAIRDRDPEHGRMLLDVEPVAQAQRPELVLGELAAQEALGLVPILGHAPGDKLPIEGIVAIHVVVPAAFLRCRARRPRTRPATLPGRLYKMKEAFLPCLCDVGI